MDITMWVLTAAIGAVGWWIRTSLAKLESKVEGLGAKIGDLAVSAAERTAAERALESRLESMQKMLAKHDDDLRAIQIRCATYHDRRPTGEQSQ